MLLQLAKAVLLEEEKLLQIIQRNYWRNHGIMRMIVVCLFQHDGRRGGRHDGRSVRTFRTVLFLRNFALTDAEMEHGAKSIHKYRGKIRPLNATPSHLCCRMLKTPAVTALAQSMSSATWNPKKYDSKPPIADTRRHCRYCSSQHRLKGRSKMSRHKMSQPVISF